MPKRIIAALVFGTLAMQAPVSVAQNAPDCSDPQSQSAMTICAERSWRAADAELNEAYKIAMAKLRKHDSQLPDNLKGGADALRDAQRSWIPYRDKACEAYGFQARGGTMEPMLVYGCLARLTRERVADLKDLAGGGGN